MTGQASSAKGSTEPPPPSTSHPMAPDRPAATDPMATDGPRVSDRSVITVLLVIVAVVIIVWTVTASIPDVKNALETAPILLIILVVGTVWVMVRALTRRRRD